MKKASIIIIYALLVMQTIFVSIYWIQDREAPTGTRSAVVISGSDTITITGLFFVVSPTLPAIQHSDSLVTITIPQVHCCIWEDCQQTGRSRFISSGKYDPGTDGYLWEQTHFDHPTWTNLECEDYIFSQLKL